MQVVDGTISQIWLYESSDGTRSRFTFGPYYNVVPRWSPDGTRILFASDRIGPFGLYVRDASGVGNDELLHESQNWCLPSDWSPDGQYITFTESNPKTNFDLWVLKLGGKNKATPVLITDANEASAMFSPDGKWLAYSSDESGQPEIYVQSFPIEKGGKWQVSTNGGYTPKWSKDGKELFYLSLDNQIDPNQRAFYYARILEIPTPRWTAYDAKFFKVQMPKEVSMVQQERAYTSPIWYTP